MCHLKPDDFWSSASPTTGTNLVLQQQKIMKLWLTRS
jgi:hypothetical protein